MIAISYAVTQFWLRFAMISVQNRFCFVTFSGCGKHVSAFGVRRRRVARKASFLFKSGHRFVVHAF